MTFPYAQSDEIVTALESGWEMMATSSGEFGAPQEFDDGGDWLNAPVPGTVAQALRDAGRWTLDQPEPLEGCDYWYRRPIIGTGIHHLRFLGLATLAEVWLDDQKILVSDNMFLAHRVAIALNGESLLYLCFRALGPALKVKKGRARWRPRMIVPDTMRFIRTTLLGHMPGWCPSVQAVGPWRAVDLIQPSPQVSLLDVDLRASLDGEDGLLAVTLKVDWRSGGEVLASMVVDDVTTPLRWTDSNTLSGALRLPKVKPWWPHTHGKPALYAVTACIGGSEIVLGRVGFRHIEIDRGHDGRGFSLKINGVPIFCRGACWSNADIVGLPSTRAAYAPGLELMRKSGMNMVRVGGTMTYEAQAFHNLCDELGILVWQDFMFANFDYPIADPAFRQSVEREADQLLRRLHASPSLTVLCGGSEAEQQAAMFGLSREVWKQSLFEDVLREAAERLCPDVPYVTNSPSGGGLPFTADSGVTHYYGVGAYCRPLDDARRAQVRFASECLAFANVPDAAGSLAGVPAVHHPKWKERVPRDLGASWDFEDIRDHYLTRLYDVDASRLRMEDPDRYLRLSRSVSGEVMETVFGEWRRAGSECSGGLVWMLQDLWKGAGWGVVDATGEPKAAWHGLRRAFKPVQLIVTDEGVNGVAVHVVNETAEEIKATVSLACLRHGRVPVAQASRAMTLAPRRTVALRSNELFESFFDISYAYRFGPPAHDVTIAVLSDTDTGARLAEAFHFPQGRNLSRIELGLTAAVELAESGWQLRLASRCFAQSVHVEDDHFLAEDAWFHLAPNTERVIRLLPRGDGEFIPDGEVFALNALAPTRYTGAM